MIDPWLMCMRHLAGEHGELHKHLHNWAKQHSVAGRVSPVVLLEPDAYAERHDELQAELQRRARAAGRKPPHSPLAQPDFSYLPPEHRRAKVDRAASLAELKRRCPECCDRINSQKVALGR